MLDLYARALGVALKAAVIGLAVGAVVCCGLEVGSMIKKRFEVAHAQER